MKAWWSMQHSSYSWSFLSTWVCIELFIILLGRQVDPYSTLGSPLCRLLGFFRTGSSPLIPKNLYSGKDMGTILVLQCRRGNLGSYQNVPVMDFKLSSGVSQVCCHYIHRTVQESGSRALCSGHRVSLLLRPREYFLFSKKSTTLFKSTPPVSHKSWCFGIFNLKSIQETVSPGQLSN